MSDYFFPLGLLLYRGSAFIMIPAEAEDLRQAIANEENQ